MGELIDKANIDEHPSISNLIVPMSNAIVNNVEDFAKDSVDASTDAIEKSNESGINPLMK